MPRLGRQVHRLEGAAGFLVEDVEALHQAQEVRDLGLGARATALFEVVAERRPADGREDEVPAADVDVARAVARAQREFRGCERELLAHQAAIEPQGAELIDLLGACGPQRVAAAGLEEAHAAGFEHGERAIDDRVHLVGAQDLDRRVGIGEPREWQLPDSAGDAFFPAPATQHATETGWRAARRSRGSCGCSA